MVSHGFPIFVPCCWLILIVGPRPIFSYLMISKFLFVWIMFLIDLNRRPSPDVQISYDFPWFCYVFGWFEPSALARSSVILWCPMVLYSFLMVLLYFWLILIIDPRLIFGALMISFGFAWFSYGLVMFLVDFNLLPSPDPRLSFDFLWFCIVFLWFCYVFG